MTARTASTIKSKSTIGSAIKANGSARIIIGRRMNGMTIERRREGTRLNTSARKKIGDRITDAPARGAQ